jgi:hypothetical protein
MAGLPARAIDQASSTGGEIEQGTTEPTFRDTFDYMDCLSAADEESVPTECHTGMSGGGVFVGHVETANDGARSVPLIVPVGVNFWQSEAVRASKRLLAQRKRAIQCEGAAWLCNVTRGYAVLQRGPGCAGGVIHASLIMEQGAPTNGSVTLSARDINLASHSPRLKQMVSISSLRPHATEKTFLPDFAPILRREPS